MEKTVKWGVLGCGAIANTVTSDFIHADNAQVVAAASRNLSKSEDFCRKHSIPRAYGSYQELLDDSEVEMVYIALPHSYHYPWTLKALEAGKSVLCEKPLTLNAKQSREVIALAESKGLFLAEAWWTYYFPLTQLVKQWKSSHVLGKLMRSEVNFCFALPEDPNPRMIQPELGGGALLDIGIYPLGLSLLIHDQQPAKVETQWVKASTGVDLEETITLQYPDNSSASLHASLCYNSPHRARFYFEKGQVDVSNFFHPDKILLTLNDDAEVDEAMMETALPLNIRKITNPFHEKAPSWLIADDYPGNGYQYEIRAVSSAFRVKNGDFFPHGRTLQVMDLMDSIRNKWGLVYPGESLS